jgi:hypothetical protein
MLRLEKKMFCFWFPETVMNGRASMAHDSQWTGFYSHKLPIPMHAELPLRVVSISSDNLVPACMQVMDQIQGLKGRQLPWEGANLTAVNRSRLGIFRGSVLMLLSRDPAKRPSMQQFCETCDRVLAGSSTVQV